MNDLTHKHERFGCTIMADLENTVAVLTDPDGEEFNFVADKDHNALWHALQHAKADMRTREAERIAKAKEAREAKADEPDEPTDIMTTDVEHVEGAIEQ